MSRRLTACSLPLLATAALLFVPPAFAKDGPTYFTPERVAAAKKNIAEHDWAKAIERRIFETGDPIAYFTGRDKYVPATSMAAQSDILHLAAATTTAIPRMNRPRHGPARVPHSRQGGPGSQHLEPVAHRSHQPPVQGAVSHRREWLPTNDYHRGDLTSGDFPDDGSGILHDGKRYHLLSFYAHMAYGSVVVPALKTLSEAYQLTGDPNYGRKGCILLARLASEYPNYGWDAEPDLGLPAEPGLENRFDRTYLGPWQNQHPHYDWKHGGMITDLIWETFNLETTAYAYDGLYDYMDQDPDMLAFLRGKGMPVDNAGRPARVHRDIPVPRRHTGTAQRRNQGQRRNSTKLRPWR